MSQILCQNELRYLIYSFVRKSNFNIIFFRPAIRKIDCEAFKNVSSSMKWPKQSSTANSTSPSSRSFVHLLCFCLFLEGNISYKILVGLFSSIFIFSLCYLFFVQTSILYYIPRNKHNMSTSGNDNNFEQKRYLMLFMYIYSFLIFYYCRSYWNAYCLGGAQASSSGILRLIMNVSFLC